jgi:hypothetical protein
VLKVWDIERVDEPVVVLIPGHHDLFLPEAWVIGLVSAFFRDFAPV